MPADLYGCERQYLTLRKEENTITTSVWKQGAQKIFGFKKDEVRNLD
jgi:hypothetical protein